MNRILVSIFTAALLTVPSLAQTSADTQAGGSVSQSSSVSADQSGAQVQSQTGAQATGQGSLSSTAGNQSAQAASASQLAAGNTIHASLVKPVDARKCKPGDEVIAKTTQSVRSNGEVVIPKGARIVGHVTQAKATTKGDSGSAVGIAFDRAVLKDGSEVPMTASIQAISKSQEAASADTGMADGSLGAGESTGAMASGRAAGAAGGAVGGVGRVAGSTSGTLVNTAGSTTGATLKGAGSSVSSTGALSSSSHGVIGLNGLSLNSVTENSAQGSLITSHGQNVHLDSGTQMILLVSGK